MTIVWVVSTPGIAALVEGHWWSNKCCWSWSRIKKWTRLTRIRDNICWLGSESSPLPKNHSYHKWYRSFLHFDLMSSFFGGGGKENFCNFCCKVTRDLSVLGFQKWRIRIRIPVNHKIGSRVPTGKKCYWFVTLAVSSIKTRFDCSFINTNVLCRGMDSRKKVVCGVAATVIIWLVSLF